MALPNAHQTDGIAVLKAVTSGPPGSSELGEVYGEMVTELRDFLDALAGAAVGVAEAERLREQLAALTPRLRELEVDERSRLWGHWMRHAGRGQALVPMYGEVVRDDSVTGTVTFGRFHVGENMAVHGGAVTLLFDDVLGWLMVRLGLAPSRTAYLTTHFRSITPVGVELNVLGWIDHIEGRKRFLRGELWANEVLCAEVEGLWVELRQGQR